MAFSAGSSATSSEINVTPLIDVLLVLLIIFMVMVPVAPHGLESAIPPPAGKPAASSVQPVLVRIVAAAQGDAPRYRIGGQEAAFAELRPRLRQMFAVREDRTLYVQADRGLSYQQVAEVAGLGRAAGAGAVALVTGK